MQIKKSINVPKTKVILSPIIRGVQQVMVNSNVCPGLGNHIRSWEHLFEASQTIQTFLASNPALSPACSAPFFLSDFARPSSTIGFAKTLRHKPIVGFLGASYGQKMLSNLSFQNHMPENVKVGYSFFQPIRIRKIGRQHLFFLCMG